MSKVIIHICHSVSNFYKTEIEILVGFWPFGSPEIFDLGRKVCYFWGQFFNVSMSNFSLCFFENIVDSGVKSCTRYMNCWFEIQIHFNHSIVGCLYLGYLKDTIYTKLTLMPWMDDNLGHTLSGLTQIGNIIAIFFQTLLFFKCIVDFPYSSVGRAVDSQTRTCEFKSHSW